MPIISGINQVEFKTINLNDGLIGYWNFNDEFNVGYDDSGNGNFGTNYGAEWKSYGISGGCLDFENDEYDYLNFSSPVHNSPPYTICAWIKPESEPNGANRYILGNGGQTYESHGL